MKIFQSYILPFLKSYPYVSGLLLLARCTVGLNAFEKSHAPLGNAMLERQKLDLTRATKICKIAKRNEKIHLLRPNDDG